MKDHESTADTAKRIRKALKHYFPSVKFSVRSKVYSGGASIDVRWTDGPRTKAVEHIAKAYEGADFDGMIDLKTHHSTIILDAGGPARSSSGPISCSVPARSRTSRLSRSKPGRSSKRGATSKAPGTPLGSVTHVLLISPAEWSAHSTLRRAPRSRTHSARSSFVNERGCA